MDPSNNTAKNSTTKNRLALALAAALTLPLAPLASAADVNVLYPPPATNDNLSVGNYAFGGSHPQEQTFIDEFNFSLGSADAVGISINDIMSPDTAPTPSPSGSKYLFDNKYLTFTVFDHLGNYVGSGAEGSALNLTGLASGEMYTLTVSGKASGIFGGQYQGNVDVGEVPIGPALPMFSAALLTLCVRRRKLIAAQ